MLNREIYQRDPCTSVLVNQGVAVMSDAMDADERRTLRFELEHFVCEGEYQRGLVRILESFTGHQGRPELPAAWVSGFFGSGKSHLVKMLRFLWTDYKFPEDGASARGLANLPGDVSELLTELSVLGKRIGGLHAAAGTLGAGATGSVRLALLGIVFKSKGLPQDFTLARFCLWLKREGYFESVKSHIVNTGRDFKGELNNLYVSRAIASSLLKVDPNLGGDIREVRSLIKSQFPRKQDITSEELVLTLKDVLEGGGPMPATVIVLDEVQQFIGDNADRTYQVQEMAETCSKQFGDRLLFVGTGQTALSGTPNLQKLQGRFGVNVELSDTDVETVTRRVVLAKRSDQVENIRRVLENNAGEIDRHLAGTAIAARQKDRNILVDDYPVLPVRRRFWEHVLRAVDKAGTAGQLRTQLRIVYESIKHTAKEPLGNVVPADFLFDEISEQLLRTGVLLGEIHSKIIRQEQSASHGSLKKRICALVFLIRSLPREAGADIGLRTTVGTLADLLVQDLSTDGARLRGHLPTLLEELTNSGTLLKMEDEYSLQTRESSEWEAQFKLSRNKVRNDPTLMGNMRTQLIKEHVGRTLTLTNIRHGKSKVSRRLVFHYGSEGPERPSDTIPVWIRDGWGERERTVIAEAQVSGLESPVVYVFIPKSQTDALRGALATGHAAQQTLDLKGIPTTDAGRDARRSMQTRLSEAKSRYETLIGEIVGKARVFQGGGSELAYNNLDAKIRKSVEASLDRQFPRFADADDHRWNQVLKLSKREADSPLAPIGYQGKVSSHAVCKAIISEVGSGKTGRDIRKIFSSPPFGWSRDAIDGSLMALTATGHLRANHNGSSVLARDIDQRNILKIVFRIEGERISTSDLIRLRTLFSKADVTCKPKQESQAAAVYLNKLREEAERAGGDAPLPERPDLSVVSELLSLQGNQQLARILDHYDILKEKFVGWKHWAEVAQERLPSFQRLEALANHAKDLAIFAEVQPQIDAIKANRSLLASNDPVRPLSSELADALRISLLEAEHEYARTYEEEMSRLNQVKPSGTPPIFLAESCQNFGLAPNLQVLFPLYRTF